MSDLDQIIDVQITRETIIPSRLGFGTLMIIGESSVFQERSRTYTGIDSVADDFTSTDPEYLMASKAFSQSPKPTRIKIGRKDALETWTEALDGIVTEDDDFYGIAITSRTQADILEVAAWAEARIKIYSAASADAGVKAVGSSDIASLLKTAGYDRTFLSFHNSAATEYPDSAWLAKLFPYDPGSATWKFKRLNGVTVDTLTPSQKTLILGKNANTYTTIAGANITEDGTMASGEYIDVIRGVDWLTAQIQEGLYFILVNSLKVPYTDPGIAVVETLIRGKLDLAIERGVLAPESYTVSVPKVLDTDPLDRGDRILRDVTFEARLAGAIHKIIVRGTVTV